MPPMPPGQRPAPRRQAADGDRRRPARSGSTSRRRSSESAQRLAQELLRIPGIERFGGTRLRDLDRSGPRIAAGRSGAPRATSSRRATATSPSGCCSTPTRSRPAADPGSPAAPAPHPVAPRMPRSRDHEEARPRGRPSIDALAGPAGAVSASIACAISPASGAGRRARSSDAVLRSPTRSRTAFCMAAGSMRLT